MNKWCSKFWFQSLGAILQNKRYGRHPEPKNRAMAEAGIHVPSSFNDLPATIKEVYESLNLEPIPEPEMNKIPSYRRPKQFICTISDDRGEEATYAGYPSL